MPNEKLPLEFRPQVAEQYSPGLLPALMMLSGGIADIAGVATGRGLAGQRMQQMAQQTMQSEASAHEKRQKIQEATSKRQHAEKEAQALFKHLDLLAPEQQEIAKLHLENREIAPVRSMLNSAIRQRQDRQFQLQMLEKKEAGEYKKYAKDRLSQIESELKTLSAAQPYARKALEALRSAPTDVSQRSEEWLFGLIGGNVDASTLRKLFEEQAGIPKSQARALAKKLAAAFNEGELKGVDPLQAIQSGAIRSVFYGPEAVQRMDVLQEEKANLQGSVTETGLIQTALTSPNPRIVAIGRTLMKQLEKGQLRPELMRALQEALAAEQK